MIFSNLYSQLDTRATCKSSGLKIQAYVKPFQAPIQWPNGNNTLQMEFVFSLPANGAMNTSNAPVPVSVSSPITGSIQSFPIGLANDRYIYTYYMPPAGGIGTMSDWATGSEHLCMELTFPSSVSGQFPRLDNCINSGSGGGQAYFYFEVNSTQRSDSEGDPFYDGLEGLYQSSDQYVQALAPLPIKLISFDANRLDTRSANVVWSTSSEINSSHFLIQRSFDKLNWTDIGQVKAAGYSQVIQSYDFVDQNVYDGKTANLTAYYRLYMVDLDNTASHSPIKSVQFSAAIKNDALAGSFLVYPNPASEGVHVEWDANQVDQPTAIEIYDMTGKLVHNVTVSDQTNQKYIDFTKSNLQPGLFLMRIMSGDQAIEHKQIVVSQNH